MYNKLSKVVLASTCKADDKVIVIPQAEYDRLVVRKAEEIVNIDAEVVKLNERKVELNAITAISAG